MEVYMINKLLKGTEIAEVLNISKAYAYRLIAEGEIPSIRIRRTVRVRPEDLEFFIERSMHPDKTGLAHDIMPI
jgi:excisionase family DNA binding protein